MKKKYVIKLFFVLCMSILLTSSVLASNANYDNNSTFSYLPPMENADQMGVNDLDEHLKKMGYNIKDLEIIPLEMKMDIASVGGKKGSGGKLSITKSVHDGTGRSFEITEETQYEAMKIEKSFLDKNSKYEPSIENYTTSASSANFELYGYNQDMGSYNNGLEKRHILYSVYRWNNQPLFSLVDNIAIAFHNRATGLAPDDTVNVIYPNGFGDTSNFYTRVNDINQDELYGTSWDVDIACCNASTQQQYGWGRQPIVVPIADEGLSAQFVMKYYHAYTGSNIVWQIASLFIDFDSGPSGTEYSASFYFNSLVLH